MTNCCMCMVNVCKFCAFQDVDKRSSVSSVVPSMTSQQIIDIMNPEEGPLDTILGKELLTNDLDLYSMLQGSCGSQELWVGWKISLKAILIMNSCSHENLREDFRKIFTE